MHVAHTSGSDPKTTSLAAIKPSTDRRQRKPGAQPSKRHGHSNRLIHQNEKVKHSHPLSRRAGMPAARRPQGANADRGMRRLPGACLRRACPYARHPRL